MIEFRLKFDEKKSIKNGKVASELMDNVAKTLKKESTTIQLNENIWQDDSEEAMCIFGDIINDICEDNSLFKSLEYMSWNIDGIEEDNIQCELEWRKRHR